MASNKQNTLEWLKDSLEEYGDPGKCEITWEDLDSIFEKAKLIYDEEIKVAFGNGYLQGEMDNRNKSIGTTFIPNTGASRTESPDSDLVINRNGRTKTKFNHK